MMARQPHAHPVVFMFLILFFGVVATINKAKPVG